MKSTKNMTIAFAAVLLMVSTGPLAAAPLTVTGTAPQFNDADVTAAMANIWSQILSDLNDKVNDFDDNPVKLGKAFATAGSIANHAGTQRAYQGYDLFAVTLGSMISLKSPYSISEIADGALEHDAADTIDTEGDIGIGFGWQVWALQGGLNAGFLLDGLYLSAKFGAIKFDMPTKDHAAKVDFLTLGVLANYQIFKERSLFGALVWRGLSVGSGFIYQKTNTGVIYKVQRDTPYTYTVGGTGPLAGEELEVEAIPNVSFILDSHIITIPVEVTTSVRLLWVLNLSIGIGADISFGKSSMLIKAHSDASIVNDLGTIEQTQKGTFETTAGVKDAQPKPFVGKAMANIGFGVGPVVVDFPITYYFDNAFSIGASVGLVW